MARELEKTLIQIGAGREIFMIPEALGSDSLRKWTVVLKNTAAGTASIQWSATREKLIEDDPDNAEWNNTPGGVQAGKQIETFVGPINAIAINSISGSWEMEILGEL